MGILNRLARWLECEDPLTPADAILVLEGGQGRDRVSAGLDLLRRGYAPRLLVSHTTYESMSREEVEAVAAEEPQNLYWLSTDAVSTREEAAEARRVLRRLRCSSVLVVTSCYHTRRAREICTREFAREGITARVFPVRGPALDAKLWWKSHAGRAAVLFELAKLLCAKLRFDPPISGNLRHRLKQWVERTIP